MGTMYKFLGTDVIISSSWYKDCGCPDGVPCRILHYDCFNINGKECNFLDDYWWWSVRCTLLPSKTLV
jgi:hypothetical protein